MKSGPAKGLRRIGKNRFVDCQGTVYQYNVPYEENEEEDPEEDEILEVEAEPDSEIAAKPTASKTKPKGKAKAVPKTKSKPRQDDLETARMIKPPSHISSNNIYSNVYRLAMSRDGLSLDKAKDRARGAANDFRLLGKVRQDWIGSFRKPRSPR
ncbi:unnamed protein product [Symbiodinium sp. CCMP2456]|nr:unnamed protein product [Symbiodinium sp. CCMP2456]